MSGSGAVTWRLPDKIQIGGQFYRIQVQPLVDAFGGCEKHKKIILLQDEYSDASAFLVTFFHECIHAIECEYHVGGDGDDDRIPERDVDRLAQGLTQVLLALLDEIEDDD